MRSKGKKKNGIAMGKRERGRIICEWNEEKVKKEKKRGILQEKNLQW